MGIKEAARYFSDSLFEVYYSIILAISSQPERAQGQTLFVKPSLIHVYLNGNPSSFFQGLPGSMGLVMDVAQPPAVPGTLITAIGR